MMLSHVALESIVPLVCLRARRAGPAAGAVAIEVAAQARTIFMLEIAVRADKEPAKEC